MGRGFFDFTSKFFNRKPVAEETDGMKREKELLLKEIEVTKNLERELRSQKFNEKQRKLKYQHLCPHLVLSPATKDNSQTNSTLFNDYTAKCELCEAQLWNKSRIISYLNALIDLVNKYPKVQETLKILSFTTANDEELFLKLSKLPKELSILKDKFDIITDKDVMNVLKNRYQKD